ncbi:MAG: hypothetical protein IPI77_18450 [Saprospiraceae bacterium]|nr:hypothetical protein [Saprospiraceae bacterium]
MCPLTNMGSPIANPVPWTPFLKKMCPTGTLFFTKSANKNMRLNTASPSSTLSNIKVGGIPAIAFESKFGGNHSSISQYIEPALIFDDPVDPD